MATPNHSHVLPCRGSARFNDHTQCFETLTGASIPAEWVPPGRTITVLDLLALLMRIEHREKGGQHDLPHEAFQNVRTSIAHKAYMEEIEPLVKQIVSIKSLAVPPYLLHEDGHIEATGDGLTEPMRRMINYYQDRIEEIAARYRELLEQGGQHDIDT